MAGKAVKQTLHIFIAHKRVLATPASFFEAMMETAGQGVNDEDSEAGLPAIRMEESAPVVKILLAAAYNQPSVLATLLESKDWKFVLDVWEASNKYSFHVLKSLSSYVLQSLVALVDDVASLHIYARAAMFDDKGIGAVFLDKASKSSAHRITIETLHQLPATALNTLVSAGWDAAHHK